MRFTICVLALLAGLSAFAKTNPYDFSGFTDVGKFDQQFLLKEKVAAEKQKCARAFMTSFLKMDSAVRPTKLELLAEAICDNHVIAHHFISATDDLRAIIPPMGLPLLISLHDASRYDVQQMTQAMHETLFPGEFTLENTNLYNIGEGMIYRNANKKEPEPLRLTPRQLDPGRQNVLYVDIDEWIEKREQKFTGELQQWMEYVFQVTETTPVFIAVAEHNPNFYESHGHREAGMFLKYFKQIYFNDYKPKTGDCQGLL